jgi:hypothetical protein
MQNRNFSSKKERERELESLKIAIFNKKPLVCATVIQLALKNQGLALFQLKTFTDVSINEKINLTA